MYLNPKRVFWSMLDNSLSTQGVTVEMLQQSGSDQLKQYTQMELGATDKAHALTILRQGTSEVRTEIIGTQNADYTRYLSIKTSQKGANGKPLDFSKVLKVWAKSDDSQQTTTQSGGHQQFAQAVLGIGLPVGSVPVPIGAVTSSQRQSLVGGIKGDGMYNVSFKDGDVKKERKNGRLLYTYSAKIQTILYVRYMKEFAKDLGFHELDSVDPNTYQSAAPLNVKLTVDAHSRQLVGVDTGQGYTQTYSGYGLPLQVGVPGHPISSAELQRRLSNL